MNAKEKVQYGSAVAMIASAIILVFVSFIMTLTVGGGVLTYVGEAFGGGLAIFGVASYFKADAEQFKTEVRREIEQERTRVSSSHQDTEPTNNETE